MKIARLITISVLLALSIAGSGAAQVVFKLKPVILSSGWQISGTLTTDGTVGPLTSANIVDWNVKVVQTIDMVWTEKDSNDLNISGVSTDGKKIHVATSPDGIQDGGTLYFSRGGSGGRIPTSAVLADFTQLSHNLGYGLGIPTMPNGFVNYYMGNFGVMGDKTPLIGTRVQAYTVTVR